MCIEKAEIDDWKLYIGGWFIISIFFIFPFHCLSQSKLVYTKFFFKLDCWLELVFPIYVQLYPTYSLLLLLPHYFCLFFYEITKMEHKIVKILYLTYELLIYVFNNNNVKKIYTFKSGYIKYTYRKTAE